MFDTPYSIAGRCRKIKDEGHGAVIRYLSPDTANFPNKQLSSAEVADAATSGIWLMGVWEKMGDLSEMTYATGKAHASDALAVYKSLCAPAGAAIAFACDFDPTQDQVWYQVKDYFSGAWSVINADGTYKVACYGSQWVIQAIYELGYCHFRWLAGAYGWSEGAGETVKNDPTQWEILQLPEKASAAGLDVDIDQHTQDPSLIGFWLPAA